jgi:hypothetical protein
MQKCTIGRIILSSQCITCPEGTFSLDPAPLPGRSTCKACPASSLCSAGLILPKTGFWVMDNRSELILQCDNQPSCLGLSFIISNNNTNSLANMDYA